MFTIEQISAAHSKVKSGADFPTYIRDIIKLGVNFYETRVANGQTNYYAKDGTLVASPEKYARLDIAATSNPEQFKADLLAHQNGKTDYRSFIAECAKSGIEKWAVCMEEMTCTYYDKANNKILVERIPS